MSRAPGAVARLSVAIVAMVVLVVPATALAGIPLLREPGLAVARSRAGLLGSNSTGPPVPTTVVATIPLDGVGTGLAYFAPSGTLFLTVDQQCNLCLVWPGDLQAINVTTNSVTPIPPTLDAPAPPVLDPGNDRVLVAGGLSGNLSEYSAFTGGFLSQVALEPSVGLRVRQLVESPCYDPEDGDLYISFNSLAIGVAANLTVLAPSNGTILENLTLAPMTEPPVYDPVDGDVYVAFSNGSSDGAVAVVNGSTNRWIANVGVGADPDAPVVDTSNGLVYVANVGDNNVTVLDGATAVGSVSAGVYEPTGAVYDPEDGYVYVSDYGGNVQVVDGEEVLADLPVNASTAPGFYDPDDGFVYVPEMGSGDVAVLDGLTFEANLSTLGAPTSLALDPANGELYATTDGTIVEVLGPAPPPPREFLGIPVPAGYVVAGADVGLTALAAAVTAYALRRPISARPP